MIGIRSEHVLESFVNAYLNRHAHAEYLKRLKSIVPLAYGMIFYIVLTPTKMKKTYHIRSMKYRQYV